MGLDCIDICPQHAFPAHGVDQPNFHAGQLNVRRKQVNALAVMQNTAAVRNRGIVDHILHDVCQRDRQFIRLWVAEGEGQRALRICINKQHPLVLMGKPDAEVSGGRSFAHAALLVRHCDHFAICHMGFLLCINLAACGDADGYVEKQNDRLLLHRRSFYGRTQEDTRFTFSVERFSIPKLFC